MPLEFADEQSARSGGKDLYPSRRRDREEWLERADPVLWSEWTPAAPISREQAESFRRDGFLILKDMFEAEEVTALIERASALRDDGRNLRREDVVFEPKSESVRTIFRLEEHDPLMMRLACDRRLAGIARFLLNDDVYIHQSRLNYKPGFTGKEFYWHSDFETWHAEDGMPRMRAVSASLLLTDNRAHNGALMLMPGSQDIYISCEGETPDSNHETSLKAQEVGTPSQDSLARLSERFGITDAEGPAGTLILFDCNAIHGSNGNITPAPRSNAFFVYNAVSNRLQAPFAAAKPRPAYLARRGDAEPVEIRADRLV